VPGYWAMNYYAGKQLGLPKDEIPPKDTLYMNKKFEGKENTVGFRRVEGHEKFEIHNLRDRHMIYNKQEPYTNKFEAQMAKRISERK
jgi:hypothetical protein